MILPDCSLLEAGTANGVCGVDSGVYREAGDGDAALRFQFAGGSEEELPALARYSRTWTIVTGRVLISLPT